MAVREAEAPNGDAPVSAALRRLVGQGALTADARQMEAAQLLDGIADRFAARAGSGRFAGLFGREVAPPLGAYFYGEVGRGKTLLMDLFFSAAPIAEKRRMHFIEFMDEMHDGIARFRASPRGKRDNADPIAAVTKPLLAGTRLLCLDEFRVDDITNAMLLGRLFEKLFAGGVVLVATSNVAPDDLYQNGLNRELFLPFLALLKAHSTVFALNGPTDYRRLKFEGRQVYHFGTGPAAAAAMDALWNQLTGGVAGQPETLRVLGRSIAVPRAAMGVARFPAAALVDTPLGPRDFLRLAQTYDAIIMDGVTQFDRTRPSAAKRFILLIDALYDAGVKLGASFAVPIDQLGADDKTAAEFRRAASRLVEMQSADYLAAPRRRAVAEPAEQPEGGLKGRPRR